MTPFARWEALRSALQALPKPAQGLVRVYRGQTQAFGSMVPTGLRRPLPAEDVWVMYAKLLSLRMQAHAQAAAAWDDLASFLVWLHAIRQHYGPGTEFLDVTHSPAVAAWFALHRAQTAVFTQVYGSDGPFDPVHDIVGAHEYLRFVPHTEQPGHLYAFDVPAPTQDLSTAHGTLVDLALAPAPLRDSPRLRAQQACLLRAHARSAAGDLSAFIVPGTPLPVAWPLEGCAEIAWPTERLFPGVAEDPWYRRFVALPLVPSHGPVLELPFAPGRRITPFAHPIPVSLIVPETDRAQLDALRQCIWSVPPAIVYPYALRMAAKDPGTHGDLIWSRLAQATPILLEGPLQAATAAIDGGLWLFALLLEDIAAAVPVQDDTGATVGQASLHNVFIEFSPLEYADWPEADAGTEPMDFERALWLLRDDDGVWWATLVREELHGRGVYIAGPSALRVAPDGRGLQLRGRSEHAQWMDLLDLELLARPIVKSLAMLRDLSPGWKLAATPELSIDGSKHQLPIRSAIGRLVSLAGHGESIEHHFALRRVRSAKTYFGGAGFEEAGAVLEVQSEGPLATLDPATLRAQAAERIARLAPPAR